MKTIVLAGGTGLLGGQLAPYLADRGYQVVILTRGSRLSSDPRIRYVRWDGRSVGRWRDELESAVAVVNLAGRSVNCRYSRRNREAIYNSRIASTRVLGDAIADCRNPPPLWLNGSTATIYKHAYSPQDELTGIIAPTPEAHDEFSLHVATDWERTFFDSPTPHTRKIALRAAMVLVGGQPGVFTILRTLARLGFGGRIGPGSQYMSWIHEIDFCRAVEFLLSSELTGPVNLAAPNPVPNRQFMQAFHGLTRNPLALPTPTPLLQLGAFFLRTEPELMLKSRCVVPTRLLQGGFAFRFARLGEALRDLNSRNAG